ncbi:immunity 17 family protein [Parabacteroides sp.]
MDPSEYFILVLFIALGLFSIVAAVFNLDWYFKTSGAMTFVNWFGRGGARVFYALLGTGLIVCGVLGLIS